MADEPNEQLNGDDEVLELTEKVEPEPQEPEGEDDEELVVSFGDEAPPASSEQDNATIRQMRDEIRSQKARIKELERSPQSPVIEVGPKPTLEGCDYDEERYEQEFNAWSDRKSEADRVKSEAEKQQTTIRERFQAKVTVYGEQKDTLAAKDFDEAEAEVRSVLSDAQQSILIDGAENKAALVYALGKHPEKLRELAKLGPFEF